MDTVIETSIIAVGAAFVGTAFGYILNERAAHRRKIQDRLEKQSRAAFYFFIEVTSLRFAVELIPRTPAEVSNPKEQLQRWRLAGTLNRTFVLQTVFDLPSDILPEAASPYPVITKLSEAVDRASARASELVGVDWLDGGSKWTPESSEDPEFVARYQLVTKLREEALAMLRPLQVKLAKNAESLVGPIKIPPTPI